MKTFLLVIVFTLSTFLSLLTSHATAATMDPKALTVADASVKAIGGMENYNNTRFISWLFFDRRFHVWDKHTGDIRIEYNKGDVLLMNIHTKQGRVWEDGKEITDTKTLQEKMKWGYEVWINDSYWVVMPYKLHDDGVNLVYTREDKSLEGRPVDVLTMTFNEVGVTPDNKYEVFFDKETKRFIEFAYYPTIDTEEPRFRMPWKNWKTYGDIMLSDSRGDSGMAPITIFKTLPKKVMSMPNAALDNQGNAIKGALIK